MFYYYAVIELETGICYDVMEVDCQITDDPSCIEISSNDKSYMFRKKYVDGVWVDTTASEAQQFEGAHIGIHGEWLDIVINGKASLDHTHDGYATSDHTHTEYASSDDLQVLNDTIDTKADASHTHSEYAPLSHSHDSYVTTTTFDALAVEVNGKSDVGHSHSNYSTTTHNHDDVYSLISHSHTASEIGAADSGHNHNEDYADINHNHDSDYASLEHNHNYSYSVLGHSHAEYATFDALDELSATVSNKANTSHNHDDTYYTETEIDQKLASKSDNSHMHTGVYDESGAAASALASANAYTDSKIDALVGEGASETLDTIGEISAAIADNQEAVNLLNAAIANKANTVDLNSHANDTELHITDAERAAWNAKSNFSGSYNDLTNKPTIPSINGLATEDYVDEKVAAVTVESIGALPNTTVIPTVPTNVSAFTNDAGYLTEHQSLNGLATETYVNTQIDAIDIPSALSDLTADSTHRLVTDAEKATWNAKSDFSGSYNDLTDKPSIPSISGLATEIYVDEAVSTKADSGHTHAISDITNLQTTLDGKSATSHNHNSAYISKDLQFTGDNGGAIISYNRDDGKNILTEIAALPAGFYTVYSQSGTTGNPKTTEAWRFMVHKTGASAGWVQGYGSIGSVYTNYIDGTNGWRGWKCIWDNNPNPLWSGQYYMSSPNSTPQTVTPSKKLSECRTGWLLLWSDYDAGSGSNDSDFVTTIIPKNNPSGGKWGGKSFLCDIPRYVGSNAEDVDTERRIIKPIYVHDDCIKGSYQNDKDERNDVVLRAVYEI